MLKTAFVAAAVASAIAIIAVPTAAEACMNGVEHTINDDVRLVKKAEKLLEAGQYARAKKVLAPRIGDERLRTRAQDVLAVVRLRTGKDKIDREAALAYFKARGDSKDGKRDLRFRAWLAEAMAATGQVAEARTILLDLQQRDLMPDAHGYLTLAKLSTGPERLAAWKACRTRTKSKDLCELPAETRS